MNTRVSKKPCGCHTPCACQTPECDPCPPGGVSPTCKDALAGGLTRTRFYDGMLLTQSDFETEQRYWRMKRKLTNRALGRGVVWGLRASFAQKQGVFRLGPGYALDCCGNDLVVECPVDMRASKLASNELLRTLEKTKTEHAHLILEYAECPEDPRPVHTDVCATDSTRCEHTRVRESARLRLVPRSEPTLCALDAFRDQLATLRDRCPNLFPFLDADEEHESGSVPASFEFRLLGHQEIVPIGGDDEWHEIGGMFPAGQPIQLAATLSPNAGWLLTAGRAIARDVETTPDGGLLAEVRPPFDVALGWTWTLAEVPDVETKHALHAEIHDWRLSPWKSGGDAVVGGPIVLKATLTTVRRGPRVIARLEKVAVEAPSIEAIAEPTRDCFDRLSPGLIWRGDGESEWLDNPKIVLLAALHAWLSNAAPREGDDSPASAARVAATWVYVIAWRVLFGADATAPQNGVNCSPQQLADLVHDLFRRWCDQFVYAGPQCRGIEHGAVLGTVRIERGRVVAFDQHAGRRYVLTGPLLEHWLCHFGLAPIDVTFERLASWMCCIAAAPTPTLETLASHSVNDLVLESDERGRIVTNSHGPLAVGLSNHTYSTYGRSAHGEGALRMIGGATSDPARERGWLAMVELAKHALFGAQSREGSVSFRRSFPEALGDHGLHLFTPQGFAKAKRVSTDEITSDAHTIEVLTERLRGAGELAALPAMIRRPVFDAAIETLVVLPAATTDDTTSGEAARATDIALARIGATTAAAVLGADPETLSDAVWAALPPALRDESKHAEWIEGLFADAEATAHEVARAWALAVASRDGAVRRADLADEALLSAVREKLAAAGATVSSEMLRASARRAIKRRRV